MGQTCSDNIVLDEVQGAITGLEAGPPPDCKNLCSEHDRLTSGLALALKMLWQMYRKNGQNGRSSLPTLVLTMIPTPVLVFIGWIGIRKGWW